MKSLNGSTATARISDRVVARIQFSETIEQGTIADSGGGTPREGRLGVDQRVKFLSFEDTPEGSELRKLVDQYWTDRKRREPIVLKVDLDDDAGSGTVALHGVWGPGIFGVSRIQLD